MAQDRQKLTWSIGAWAIVATLVIAAVVLVVSGCGSLIKTKSPFSGENVSAEQLQTEAQTWAIESQAQAKKEAAENAAKLEAARVQAAAEIQAIQENARIEATRAQNDAADIIARANVEARRIDASASQTIAQIQANGAALAINAQAQSEKMQTAFASAQADLQRKSEQAQGFLGAVLSIPQVAAAPGASLVPAILTALLGVPIGAGAMVPALRKRKQEAEENERAARVIVNAIDAGRAVDGSALKLAMQNPIVAQAIRDELSNSARAEEIVESERIDPRRPIIAAKAA